MITYKFDQDKDILLVNYEGLITDYDVINYISDVGIKTKSLKKLKIFEDARNGEISPDVVDVDKIVETLRQFSNNYKKVIIATLQDKPVETALNILFQKTLNLENYHYKVFSTKKSALEWLSNF